MWCHPADFRTTRIRISGGARASQAIPTASLARGTEEIQVPLFEEVELLLQDGYGFRVDFVAGGDIALGDRAAFQVTLPPGFFHGTSPAHTVAIRSADGNGGEQGDDHNP